MHLLILTMTMIIGYMESKLFIELQRFSRLGETQYFIHSSAKVPIKNIKNLTNQPEVVMPLCSLGELDGNSCKEYITINNTSECPKEAILMRNKCIQLHSPSCPPLYINVDGKCWLDRGCDSKLYDQVGRNCYEKCTSGYRRYYSNLCITETRSCPIQFRRNNTNCILSECPTQMKLTEDQMFCENICPQFFTKTQNNICESNQTVCPIEYEKKKDFCLLRKCKYGLLINGICLDTVCPTGYELSNSLCKKCFTSTHSVCSEMDWKCPMGLIEIGSGPNMKCVMICPRNYAQFGKHCYDISVTGCPEGFLHFNDKGCIEASKCPSDYEIFGNECLKKSIDSGFVINGRMIEDCPLNYAEHNGNCFKVTANSCPDAMIQLEDSEFCVSSCPKGFTQINKVCLADLKCNGTESTFMGKCYEQCPAGTARSGETNSCKILPNCDGNNILDLSKFVCIDRIACNESSFISPDGKLCQRKDQCNTQGYILQQYCVESCPFQHEVSTQFCTKKLNRCPSLSLSNGTCVTQCPEGHIPKNQICVKVKAKKDNIICGINKQLQLCPTDSDNCIDRCICKDGFAEENGEDYCVPIESKCGSHHELDLLFIIDGSIDIDETSFNDMKYFLMETVTHIYSSNIDVRIGIIVYGAATPQIILLHRTIKLCDCMKLISKLFYIEGAQITTLVDAFRMASEIVLSQCNGARIGSVKQITVISKFAEFTTDEREDLIHQINLSKEKGNRLTFIAIGNNVEVPQGIYSLVAPSTKYISQYINKLFEITCKDIKCPTGYQNINNACVDINECDSQTCHNNSICFNTPGSIVCYCKEDQMYLGHEIGCGFAPETCGAYKMKKAVCDVGTCKAPANCTITGGIQFCICPKGFNYRDMAGCVDIDECSMEPCLGKANCTNTYGSYDCICPKGFYYNIHFGCIDVDECENASACSGNGNCENMVGSYRCTCNSGYEYIQSQGCIDINECKQSNTLCQGENVLCQNTPGSFQCVCPKGFEYKAKGCVDIDECSTNNSCPEGSLCKNNVGGFMCSCAKGFLFNNVSNTCELDQRLNVIQLKADLVFCVDASEPMKPYMKDVKDMVRNIIVDYQVKSPAVIKSYFALTTGGNNNVTFVYIKETDANVLNHTDDISYLGGKSLLSVGLQSSRDLYAKYGQTNSSKLVVLVTATKPDSYEANELSEIRNEVKKIIKEARLLIIYIGENVKNNEWKIIFEEKEIEEHVIVVSKEFVSTIHKVIYQRTDRLIKCPDGFVFLDKVCQYKTSQAKYCKWDNKLYAFNSTWSSSCATYNCTEFGVVVLETNCLGFDGDCYHENEFFPCNVNGKLNWRCRCNIVQYFEEETNQTQQRIDYITIDFDQNSTIASTKLEDENGKCVLPFKYQGMWYYACTDSKSYNRWCSNYMYYKVGYYSYCARQVTSQCLFDGKVYKEGDKWNVGCNVIVCDSGKPYVTARCSTSNGTCVPLNADNYPCEFKGDYYTSCMCLQDNFGYGENTAIKGKVTDEKKHSIEGGLVQYCEHLGSNTRYELGQSWEIDCFKLKCQENGITQIIEKKCLSLDGKCYEASDTQAFPCVINAEKKMNCQCVVENNELVMISKEGGVAERSVVEQKKYLL